jgi:hypothetical protein
MLKQLGVRTKRKDGMIRNFLEPYRAKDYRGMVEEWKKSLAK